MYLKKLMKEQHMTRSDLSQASGIPESTLRDILNGKAHRRTARPAHWFSWLSRWTPPWKKSLSITGIASMPRARRCGLWCTITIRWQTSTRW